MVNGSHGNSKNSSFNDVFLVVIVALVVAIILLWGFSGSPGSTAADVDSKCNAMWVFRNVTRDPPSMVAGVRMMDDYGNHREYVCRFGVCNATVVHALEQQGFTNVHCLSRALRRALREEENAKTAAHP